MVKKRHYLKLIRKHIACSQNVVSKRNEMFRRRFHSNLYSCQQYKECCSQQHYFEAMKKITWKDVSICFLFHPFFHTTTKFNVSRYSDMRRLIIPLLHVHVTFFSFVNALKSRFFRCGSLCALVTHFSHDKT